MQAVQQAIQMQNICAAGATITADRAEIFASADIILQVQSFGSNNENSDDDLAMLRRAS